MITSKAKRRRRATRRGFCRREPVRAGSPGLGAHHAYQGRHGRLGGQAGQGHLGQDGMGGQSRLVSLKDLLMTLMQDQLD